MRVPTFMYFLPALCLLTGCTDRSSAPTGPTTFSDPGADEIRTQIPLGDAVEGEVSLARNFYFIFDGSGSMSDRPPRAAGDRSFSSKLDGAKWAVDQFMEHVPDDVNFGLWLFDSAGSREVVSLGPGNRVNFLTAIKICSSGGGTPLAEAIREGVDQLVAQYKRQLGYGEFRLVVVTDGEAEDIPAAAAYAEKFGIPIYTIGFCVNQDHPLRAFSISYRTANSAEDLRQGLEEAIAESDTFDPTVFEELE